MKPFLILQARPEIDAAHQEFAAILNKCHLPESRVHRVCLDKQELQSHDLNADYAGIIVGGGPGCISDKPNEKEQIEAKIEHRIMSLMPSIVNNDIPFIGCCYGLSILAHYLGAEVSKKRYSESVGPSKCTLTDVGLDDPITKNLDSQFMAFVGHKEAVQSLPENCTLLVTSSSCPIQMIKYKRNIYATQFHPEATANDIENRIITYKNHGYFPSEEAADLIKICNAVDVTEPAKILKAFTDIYGC
ncbi:MAG: glutamine amidotransferase [Aestuariivita sp.]|nr:glutamine amidotransferase [Aestuariivita sp.]